MYSDEPDLAIAALADPTRRAIVARLASGKARVTELTEPFDMMPPSISRHLKVLERAGLISRSCTAQTGNFGPSGIFRNVVDRLSKAFIAATTSLRSMRGWNSSGWCQIR